MEPGWAFRPESGRARVIITGSVFEDLLFCGFIDDPAGAEIAFRHNIFHKLLLGPYITGSFLRGFVGLAWLPAVQQHAALHIEENVFFVGEGGAGMVLEEVTANVAATA